MKPQDKQPLLSDALCVFLYFVSCAEVSLSDLGREVTSFTVVPGVSLGIPDLSSNVLPGGDVQVVLMAETGKGKSAFPSLN